MFVRPTSWSQINPKAKPGKPPPRPAIQLFGVGYDLARFEPRVVYIRIYPTQESRDLIGQLFLTQGIGPYQLIQIAPEGIEPLGHGPPYTSADQEFLVAQEAISALPFHTPEETAEIDKLTSHPLTTIYWDIESYSPDGTFTDAGRPKDEVVSISLLLDTWRESKGYVLTTLTEFDPEQLPADVGQVIKCATEAELISQFFRLLGAFHPQLQVTYNGDSYDKPYLVTRADLLGLEKPALSRIYSLRGIPTNFTIPSTFPNAVKDVAIEYLVPDTESLDMVLYFRRFRPDLPNFRLETVSQEYLGTGKTDLSIDKLFEVVRSRDPVGEIEVISYSYTDSVLLKQLLEVADVLGNLTRACNLVRVTRQEFLRLTDPELIIRLFTRHLPHLGGGGNQPAPFFEPISILKDASPGIYRDLHRVDYSQEVGRQVISQFYSADVAAALKSLPLPLQLKAIYSSYTTDPDDTVGELDTLIRKLPQGLVAILPHELWYLRTTHRQARVENLVLVKGAGKYLTVKVDEHGKIDKIYSYGGKGCSFCDAGAEFPFKKLILKRYIQGLLDGKDLRGWRIHSISKEQASLFLIKKRVKAHDPYSTKEDSLSALVAAKGIMITTWLMVDTLRVVKDPKLARRRLRKGQLQIPRYVAGNSYFYPLLTEADVDNCPPIDVTYYLASLNKMLEELDQLEWVVPAAPTKKK